MNRWAPALLVGLLALAVEIIFPWFQRRVPPRGRFLIEGSGPFLYGFLPLWIALERGWLSLREVGLIGPLLLTPGTLLGWSAADWVRGLGLAGLYGGITWLALWGLGLWRPPLPRWIEGIEHGFQAMAREGLLALWRGVLAAAAFPQDPLPAAWGAFGLWWGAEWGIRARWGGRPTPALWGGALAATALFGLTGNLWLSAIVHTLVAGLTAGVEPFSASSGPGHPLSRTARAPHSCHPSSQTDHS